MATVAAVVVGSQQVVTDPTEAGWQTRGVALLVAYTADPEAPGRLVAIGGDDAKALGLLGFEPNFAATQDWPAGPDGSAPSMADVGQWWIGALAGRLAELTARFAGKRPTLFLAEAE